MGETTKSFFPSKHGVYIIAEIGGNHEGNFEYAKKLTNLAIESGADAVKFQIYTGESLVNPEVSPDRYQHFKKFQLSTNEYIELAKLCTLNSVTFMASVWDIDQIKIFDPYIPIYKIGSGDLTAYSLIKKIVETGKPIILSTGLATMKEIEQSVDFINKLDPSYLLQKKIALLQCTSMYPIPDSDTNLNVMTTFKDKFGLPVGFSNHTIGPDAIQVAVAMGAEIIEMHFTDTRDNKVFRDHKISFTRDELKKFIEKIQIIKTLQGNSIKCPTQSEIEAGHVESFRRGLYPKRDIPCGTIILENDIVALRPNVGLDASEYFNIIGKKLKVDVKMFQPLCENMFESVNK